MREPSEDARRAKWGVPADLLEPVLSGATATAPYSVQAHMVVAIFGGLFASLLLCMASARRLRTLTRDGVIFGLAALVGVALCVQMLSVLQAGDVSRREVRYALQLLGAVVFAFFYLRNRAAYTAASLMGEGFPSGWRAGLASIALGWVVMLVVLAAAQGIRRVG